MQGVTVLRGRSESDGAGRHGAAVRRRAGALGALPASLRRLRRLRVHLCDSCRATLVHRRRRAVRAAANRDAAAGRGSLRSLHRQGADATRAPERLPAPGGGPPTGGRVQVRGAAGSRPRHGRLARPGLPEYRLVDRRPADRLSSPGCPPIGRSSASAATTKPRCWRAPLSGCAGPEARPAGTVELVGRRQARSIRKGWAKADRQSNLRGAFQLDQRAVAARSRPGAGGRPAIVLVDDVYTTGATASEVSSVLVAGTGLPVYVFTFSRAVVSGEGHD